MTAPDPEGLFPADDVFAAEDDLNLQGGPRSAGLQAIHVAGRRHLEALVTDPDTALLRTRDYAPVIGYPDRGFQVTVRVTTASGRWADEYQAMQVGAITEYAYGWLMGNILERAVVLDPQALVADIDARPGCLIPATRSSILHHAPGGAEFYVVDLRRCRADVVKRAVGFERIDHRPAPLASQGELF